MANQQRIFLFWSILYFGFAWSPLCLADEVCASAVIVTGEPQAQLGSLLANRGIQTKADPHCPITKAHLTKTPEGFLLEIEDAQGRKSKREVSSLEAAATLIESWSREDLSEPLLLRKLPSKKAPAVYWSLQQESLPYAFAQTESSILPIQTLPLSNPATSMLSLSFLGGVGVNVNNARKLRYMSQLGVALQRKHIQVGLFSYLSKFQNIDPTQTAKHIGCNVDANGDGVINRKDCQTTVSSPLALCTETPGAPPGSDCPSPSTTCTVDSNGDQRITNSDCASTIEKAPLALGLGAEVSVPIAFGPVRLLPGLELSTTRKTNSDIHLRGGLNLTTSIQLKDLLALDLRISLARALYGSAILTTGLGFHWSNR
jgi:hypothetical protein